MRGLMVIWGSKVEFFVVAFAWLFAFICVHTLCGDVGTYRQKLILSLLDAHIPKLVYLLLQLCWGRLDGSRKSENTNLTTTIPRSRLRN